jgi:hypothetical protein
MLAKFLYEDTPNTSMVPISDFGVEFCYDSTSKDQTVFNYMSWFRKNDPNIGCLPEPFFTDYCITRMMRDFGEIDEKQSVLTIKQDEDNTE